VEADFHQKKFPQVRRENHDQGIGKIQAIQHERENSMSRRNSVHLQQRPGKHKKGTACVKQPLNHDCGNLLPTYLKLMAWVQSRLVLNQDKSDKGQNRKPCKKRSQTNHKLVRKIPTLHQ
jgi:hypothetical protein